MMKEETTVLATRVNRLLVELRPTVQLNSDVPQ